MSSIYADIREWEKAHAAYVSEDGTTANDRVMRRIDAATRMGVIEKRWEHLPGGFQEERSTAQERIKRIVDGMPPLTDDQLVRLAVLLHERP